MPIKRRPPQFTDFVNNKYRHEHVMITNLYIVSHTLYGCLLYECVVWAFCTCLKELYPTPLWNTFSLFNQLVFKFGNCGSLEGIQTCTCRPRISQGWLIEDGSGPGMPAKEVWYDQLANSSSPYCIVLLENKIVSNSLIDLQNMLLKDFIHIALACKWPPNHYIKLRVASFF